MDNTRKLTPNCLKVWRALNNTKGKLKLRHTKLISDKLVLSNRKLTPDLHPWTTPTSLPLRNGIKKSPATMMMTSKKDLFTNYPEDVDVAEDMSKLKTVGSASNADWLCPRESTCEAIMKNAWVAVKYCPMYPKIWSLWVAKKEAKEKKKKEAKRKLLMQRKSNMKMRTFSNALVASMFIGHWLKCELIWLLMIVVQPQPGFAMNAPKHLELNDR